MNRQILFRGKNIESKEWIYGYTREIWSDKDDRFIICPSMRFEYDGYTDMEECEVLPETICQFTGLIAEKCKSNLDKRIFEKDIFRHTKETDEGDIVGYSVVVWLEKYAAYYLIPAEHYNILIDNDVTGEA